MSEFDDAHAFVDGFFAALATRVPRSVSLKSSHDVVGLFSVIHEKRHLHSI